MSIQGVLCLSRLSQMEFLAWPPGDVGGLWGGARVSEPFITWLPAHIQYGLHLALMDGCRVGLKVWENRGGAPESPGRVLKTRDGREEGTGPSVHLSVWRPLS